MNKFIYPAGKRIRLSGKDNKIDIDALTEALVSICKGLVSQQQYIIYGCELSDNNGSVPAVMTQGAIFFNNEIFQVDTKTFPNNTVATLQNYYFVLSESFGGDRTTFDLINVQPWNFRKAELKAVFDNSLTPVIYGNLTNIRTDITSLQNSLLSKGTTFLPSQVVKTDPNSKLITESEKTAFNKDFGSSGTSTLVARDDHSHTTYVKTTTLNAYGTPELLFAAHYEKTTPTSPTIYVQSPRLNYTSTSNGSTGLYTLSINYTTPYICNVISTDADQNFYYATVHKSATSVVLNFTDSSTNHNSSFDIMIYGF